MTETDMQARPAKSAGAFRTISEVSDELKVPQHVLRFWETKFNRLRPLKRAGGRRYYRPEDVDLLRQINDLLYGKGYTIRGAQKMLRMNATPEGAPVEAPGGPETEAFAVKEPELPAMSPDVAGEKPESPAFAAEHVAELVAIRDELAAIRKRLK